MTPVIGGAIRGTGAPRDTISVTGSIFAPTTVLLVQESLGEGRFATARIVLDETDRRELIELLGGTP